MIQYSPEMAHRRLVASRRSTITLGKERIRGIAYRLAKCDKVMSPTKHAKLVDELEMARAELAEAEKQLREAEGQP